MEAHQAAGGALSSCLTLTASSTQVNRHAPSSSTQQSSSSSAGESVSIKQSGYSLCVPGHQQRTVGTIAACRSLRIGCCGCIPTLLATVIIPTDAAVIITGIAKQLVIEMDTLLSQRQQGCLCNLDCGMCIISTVLNICYCCISHPQQQRREREQ